MSNDVSGSGDSLTATIRRRPTRLSAKFASASRSVKYPVLDDELALLRRQRWNSTPPADGDALFDFDISDESSDDLQVLARIPSRLFSLPENRVDRYLVVFSLFFFPLAIPMLLRIYGFV